MTWTLTDELEAMRECIEQASPLIARCTLDAKAVVPERGQVHAWLQPPEIEWEMWDEWTTEYTCVLVAGKTTTQMEAALLMLQAITDLQHAGVNLTQATPASWRRDDNNNAVAAYMIDLKTDDTIGRDINNG